MGIANICRARATAEHSYATSNRVESTDHTLFQGFRELRLTQPSAPRLSQRRARHLDILPIQGSQLQRGPQLAIVPFQREQRARVQHTPHGRRRLPVDFRVGLGSAFSAADCSSALVISPCSASHSWMTRSNP